MNPLVLFVISLIQFSLRFHTQIFEVSFEWRLMWKYFFTHCCPSRLSGSFWKNGNKETVCSVLNIIPGGVTVQLGVCNNLPKPRSKSVLSNLTLQNSYLSTFLGELLFLMYNYKLCIYGSLIIRVFCHGFELRTFWNVKETWLLLTSRVFCLHLSKGKKGKSVVGC